MRIVTKLIVGLGIVLQGFLFSGDHNLADVLLIKSPGDLCSLGRPFMWLYEYLSDDLEVHLVDGPCLKKSDINRRLCESNVVFFNSLWPDNGMYALNPWLSSMSNTIKAAYSVWESTKIPDHWVEQANEYLDYLVVADDYLVDVYKDCGITIPIFVLAHGFHADEWLAHPIKDAINKPFVFAMSAAWSSARKNHGLLIEAFRTAFGDSPDVLLKFQVRSSGSAHVRARAFLESFGFEEMGKVWKLNNVEVNYRDLSEEDHHAFIRSCDCYVNIASGEGFSVTPREALSVGIPVIVTDNTAQKTICKTGYVCAVDSPVEIPAEYNVFGLHHIGTQFNPTVEGVAQALRDVYSNYQTYLGKARQARSWIRQYTAKGLIPLYRMLFKPTKVLLGDQNKVTSEYLMTNSVALYRKLLHVFSLQDDRKIEPDISF